MSKHKLIILVWLILLAIPIKGNTENAYLIKKKESAPFEGVLITHSVFRVLKLNELAKDSMERSLIECQNEVDALESGAHPLEYAMGFVVGLAVGALATSLIGSK